MSDEISGDQTELMVHFQEITRVETLDECRRILEQFGWDLERAVQATLGQGDSPSLRDSRPPSPPLPAAAHSGALVRFFNWGKFIVTLPFHIIYKTLTGIFRFAWTLIGGTIGEPTTPLEDVLSFITRFEQRFGTRHPVFYQGSHSQAMSDARREVKFLLVYLHTDDHRLTEHFCRDVLCNPDVIDYINSTMFFWACSSNSPEGYKVSISLHEQTYPFLAVIGVSSNVMACVGRMEGASCDPQTFLSRLQSIVNDNESLLIVARMEKYERSLNQSIRQEQDEAYEESLRADREKERRKREEREEQDRREREERQRIDEAARRKEEIARMRVELADQIPNEPESSDPSALSLVIKLPCGARLNRRFKRNQSLKYLYYYVFCNPESPDSFEICTHYPRRTLPCEPTQENPEPPTFAEFGLGKTEALFVHDLEA